jgi:acetyltransferase-like isoleucine patch superfamily enzyme
MLRRIAGDFARGAARVAAPESQAAVRNARRKSLIARTRAAAVWNNATVDLHIAPDVSIGRNVRVTFEPWTHNVLHVGAGSFIADNVLIQLKGGSIVLGPGVHLRRDAILNVAGRLECEGDNLISWNSVIHCSNDVRIGRQTTIAEQATIADSSHYFTEPDAHVWHNVRPGSVTIGVNTWVCAKATLARGANVGSHCIIGANSVVIGDVPDGSLASGIPAVVRPIPLPWASDLPTRSRRTAAGP